MSEITVHYNHVENMWVISDAIGYIKVIPSGIDLLALSDFTAAHKAINIIKECGPLKKDRLYTVNLNRGDVKWNHMELTCEN